MFLMCRKEQCLFEGCIQERRKEICGFITRVKEREEL